MRTVRINRFTTRLGNKCDAEAQNPSLVRFFYSNIFYTASASKYLLQTQNILFLPEVILV